jgi:hypothetical protein
MHLTESELLVLDLLNRGSKLGIADIAEETGLGLPTVQKATEHLIGLQLVHAIGMAGESPPIEAIYITSDGREYVRSMVHVRKAKRANFVDKLLWSIVVPVIAAGVTAYCVAWLAVKKQ